MLAFCVAFTWSMQPVKLERKLAALLIVLKSATPPTYHGRSTSRRVNEPPEDPVTATPLSMLRDPV